MIDDVKYFIKTCHLCQLNKSALSVANNELKPIRPPRLPCTMYGIDLITLPESNSGNKYVIVAMDYITKYPFAKAVPRKTAVEVADFVFNDIVAMFGVPRIIITDQGTEFRNQLDKHLSDKLGIEHRFSTPYHPQTNGLVERMNQTIKSKLVKLIEDDPKSWDLRLPIALMAIRSTANRSTGTSPFELLVGHKMRMPNQLVAENDQTESIMDLEEYGDEHAFLADRYQVLENLSQERITAREKILKEQVVYKKYYDKKHQPKDLKIGALVTKVNETKARSKGNVLELNREGPYIM
uniref:Integrase catalytic domain-containing protein n=1 Tax=Steinernema glaseri TaxID=37863 RepID=A0A1I7YHP6_9BILA